jgi:hypothetical protein
VSTSTTRHGWSAETRFCVVLFGLALALNIGLSAIGWENNLLGTHEFRQLQTALTTQHFVTDGVKLNYETPLFGPPWEMPLEFPLFQACVAWFVRITHFPLDQSGMLVSWLFFLSALPACYLLLGRFDLSAGRRLLMLSLLLLSPIYLFFSRAFLMESTVLSFSCWFLYFFVRFLDQPRILWLLTAGLCGATAGTIKVTTFAVFLVAALLLLISAWRTSKEMPWWRLLIRAGLAAAAPIAITLWWTFHTAAIRHHNPEVNFLDSHFGYWSFGDVALRLSGEYWLKTYRVWSDEIVGEAGLAFLVFYYGCLRGRHFWAVSVSLIAFLSGQLIFANLYRVHDYYFYGSAIFLVAAVGFALLELIDHPHLPRVGVWAFVTCLLGFQVSTYNRSLHQYQSTTEPVPEFVELTKSITSRDEILVLVGYDWDATVPYYAERRAFMVLNGREYSRDSLRHSLDRLDRNKIGAIIIRGAFSRDVSFLDQSMPGHPFGTQPLFTDASRNVGIWVPESRHDKLRDDFNPGRFTSLQLSFEQNMSGKPKTIHQRQISVRPEFRSFSPRPISGTAVNDFTEATVEGTKVLNCHSTSELVFRRGQGSKHLTGLYGLPHEAYARPGMTDGVEFAVFLGQSNGSEKLLFKRLVDPANRAEDQGIQHLDVTVPAAASGETLIFRTLPGPNGNASYDWSFWANLRIE